MKEFQYDHFVFPGAVPRTFVGSVLLGTLARPAAYLANYLGAISSKADLQVVSEPLILQLISVRSI